MYVWKGVGIGAGGVKNNPDLLTDIPTPVRVFECLGSTTNLTLVLGKLTQIATRRTGNAQFWQIDQISISRNCTFEPICRNWLWEDLDCDSIYFSLANPTIRGLMPR